MSALSIAAHVMTAGPGEAGAQPGKVGAKPAGKAKQAFALVTALANAREQGRTGDTKPAQAPKAAPLAPDKPIPTAEPVRQPAVATTAKPPKEKSPAAAARKETLEMPTPSPEWGVPICPVPVRPVRRQGESAASVSRPVEDKTPPRSREAAIQPFTRSSSPNVPTSVQSPQPLAGNGLTEQANQARVLKGDASTKEKAAPVGRTAVARQAQETVSKRLQVARTSSPETTKAVRSDAAAAPQVTTAHNQVVAAHGQVPETPRQVAAPGHQAVEMKRMDAGSATQPLIRAKASTLVQSPKTQTSETEPPPQAKPGKPQADAGKSPVRVPAAPQQEGRPVGVEPGLGREIGIRATVRPASCPPVPVATREMGLPEANGHEAVRPQSVMLEAVRGVTPLMNALGQGPITDGSQATALRHPGQSVSEQILDSMHASLARGEQQVEIRLHPPELGSVLVRFEEQEEQIRGVLEVSRSEIRLEIERALPEMLRNLQEAGVQVRRLEVTVTDAPQKDLDRGLLQHHGQPQQQSPDQYGNQPQRSPGGPWPFSGRPGQDVAEHSEPAEASVAVSAGRIDMLV